MKPTDEPAMNRRNLLRLGAALWPACAATPLLAQTVPTPPVARDKGLPVHSVLELFTSQGCSACPPADALLHSMRDEPGLLALSMPVTIWDHLGWKDTLAQPAFTERQKNYASARSDRQIYTPQAIINGLAHCSGADRKSLDQKLRDSAAKQGVLEITPNLVRDAAGWALQLPDSPAGRPAPAEPAKAGATARASSPFAGNILLVLFQRETVVTIGRGENNGRTTRYANVVRTIQPIGTYAGAAMRLAIPAHAHTDGKDSFAILIQSGTEKAPGQMIGAVEAPRA